MPQISEQDNESDKPPSLGYPGGNRHLDNEYFLASQFLRGNTILRRFNRPSVACNGRPDRFKCGIIRYFLGNINPVT